MDDEGFAIPEDEGLQEIVRRIVGTAWSERDRTWYCQWYYIMDGGPDPEDEAKSAERPLRGVGRLFEAAGFERRQRGRGGSHYFYFREDGTRFTVVRPHGGKKTVHPRTIEEVLEKLEL